MSSCQLCGSRVSIHGAVGRCTNPSCGAEYDVIRHGRRGDFSKSIEVAVNAQKRATDTKIYLWNEALTERMEDKTVFTGTTIVTRVGIYSPGEGKWVTGRTINVYHKIDTGAPEVSTVTPSATGPGTADLKWWLTKGGKHTFWADWPGDEYYAGCGSEVHAMHIGDYSLSPEVSVNAQPALTVIVKDALFRKPVEGAKVVVDAVEAVTDASGMASFATLAPSTYTLLVSAKDYKSTSRTVDLTVAGQAVEVGLWHVGVIALGLVGGAGVGVVVAHQALKRKG